MKPQILLIVGIVSVIFISGCIQEGTLSAEERECEVKSDCLEKTCFTMDCINYSCSYSEIIPCCGNGICEEVEAYSTCPQDCPKTYKDSLEEAVPGINEYPKLEQVFVDLYADDGFSKEEADFMKVGLKMYKEKPELKGYPKEALLYLMSRSGGPDFYDAEFFNQTLIPLAEEIAGGKEGLEAAKAIYTWVNNEMTYGRFYYPYITPKNILEKKRGVCTEYAVLITALSRAAGIPARFVGSVGLIPQGLAHAWIEVYVNGDWIAIPSTGVMDYDNDKVIEYSDLKAFENNRMVDVSIRSPYYITSNHRTDITFGYNNHIIQQMIAEVEDMLKEKDSMEAEEKLESAKNKLLLWEKEESTEKRNDIGREAMEHLLKAVAILRDGIKEEEVQVAFLEDFPIFKHVWSSNEEKIISKIVTSGIIETAELENPIAVWENFQETLNGANPKVLYLFDATAEEKTSIGFNNDCSGVDFCMIRAIDELIKNEGLDTKLNFVLYWLDDPEKIDFLEYGDIEPVVNLIKLFHENALDFMIDFIGAVDSVKDNVTETSFYLPPKFEEEYTYYIGAIGPFLKEGDEYTGGYAIRFRMVIETSIGELPLRLEIDNKPGGDGFPEYTNLIIVDELGNVLEPEGEDGDYYYSVCPSEFVDLDPGQNLIIEREGDFVKIIETGEF